MDSCLFVFTVTIKNKSRKSFLNVYIIGSFYLKNILLIQQRIQTDLSTKNAKKKHPIFKQLIQTFSLLKKKTVLLLKNLTVSINILIPSIAVVLGNLIMPFKWLILYNFMLSPLSPLFVPKQFYCFPCLCDEVFVGEQLGDSRIL